MKVEKIDHIAINVKDLAKAAKLFGDLFGMKFSKPAVFKEIDLRSSVDPLGIELVEPLTLDGPTAKAIERRGEGVSLISFKVSDLQDAVAGIESRGVRLAARFDRPRMKVAIFHPKDTYGVMIELVEYEPEHPIVAAQGE